MSKGPRWCFTVNNPGAWRPTFNPEHMHYMCYEIEHGESGTEHVQGYVRFKNRKALSTAKGLLCQEAHLEIARGNEQHNHDYCNKENGIQEFGTYDASAGSHQGSRTDLSTALEQLKAGTPKQRVFLEHPELLVKYPSGMEKAAETLLGAPLLRRDLHNTVLWGPTGTGKSHRAHVLNPEAYFTVAAPRGTFDFYSGETTVVLDEFDPLQIDIQQLLTWMDVWKVQLQCRYSNKWARWTHLIICTNLDPSLWYVSASQELRQALQRRLQAPMGRVYNVLTQQQPIDLLWWMVVPPLSGSAPPAAPPPTPATPTTPPRMKRPTPPSPTSSPPMIPPLLRRRNGSDLQDSEALLRLTTMGTADRPVYITDSDEEESQSQ